MDRAEFGRLLRDKRKSLKLTQEELAVKLGTSRSRVTKIETGTDNFGIDTFLQVSTLLELDIAAMFKEKGEH
jgi:transcriptional regulator with XRE-family HTH domain